MMVKLLSKYRSEIMGICIIWIMLFHSGIDAPDNKFFRALWYLFVSFGGGVLALMSSLFAPVLDSDAPNAKKKPQGNRRAYWLSTNVVL